MSATQARPSPSGSKSSKKRSAAARVEQGQVLRASFGKSGSGSKKKAGKAGTRAKATAAPKATASKRKAKTKSGKKARKPVYTAKTADKHELYQVAVQSPDTDARFLARVYRSTRGQKAVHFREDFCGTGLLSSSWLKLNRQNTAEGFDIDPEPVAWGLAHHFEDLGEDAARYTVQLKDVREKGAHPADVRCAQNFSYCVFKTRPELLEYFRAAREDLADDGIFVLDMHGGSEATVEMEEEVEHDGFSYIWDQDKYWPGTGEYVCYIHFRFPDKTQIKRAFTYRWRFWHLTELKDALLDAGFSRVDTYFEGTDANGEDGDGVFRKGLRGENCESWIAYLVAVK